MTVRIARGYRRLDRERVRRAVDAEAVFAAVRDVILEPKTYAERSYVRHLAMHALTKHAKLGPMEIGRLLQRHHATVLEAIKRIEHEMALYESTRADVAAIAARVREGA